MKAPVVVVGHDCTQRSDPALRFAHEEARLRGARLVIVAAYPRAIDPDLDNSDLPDAQLRAEAMTRADTARRRALGQAADDGPFEIIVAPGDPAKALLAQGREAIMIVIGRSRRPTLSRLFGHLTGRKLARRAGVPVVIVPADN